MLQILETKPSSAEENMKMDAELLDCLDRSKGPILHLYEWEKDAITYGYFIRPEKHLQLAEIEKRGIQVAKRPTGGGIVFHIWDLAFSFLMPIHDPAFSTNTLENYRFVNEIVKKAVKELFEVETPELIKESFQGPDTQFCMAKPTKYDVVLNGQKIAGAAQRKKKTGYLHQGTISLAAPREELLTQVLMDKKNIKRAMQNFSFAPLQGDWTAKDLKVLRQSLRASLIQAFREAVE